MAASSNSSDGPKGTEKYLETWLASAKEISQAIPEAQKALDQVRWEVKAEPIVEKYARPEDLHLLQTGWKAEGQRVREQFPQLPNMGSIGIPSVTTSIAASSSFAYAIVSTATIDAEGAEKVRSVLVDYDTLLNDQLRLADTK